MPFLAELIKHIDLDVCIDFMDVSSYEGTESIGDVKVKHGFKAVQCERHPGFTC